MSSPSSNWTGVSSVPSDSRACNSPNRQTHRSSKPGRYGGDGAAVQSQGRVGGQRYIPLLGSGFEGPQRSDWVEPQGELLPVQVYAGGREREAGKPMTWRLQWWHLGRKTAGLAWIPASAGELWRSQRERPGWSAARTQCRWEVYYTAGKGGGAGAEDAAADGRAKCDSTRAAAC